MTPENKTVSIDFLLAQAKLELQLNNGTAEDLLLKRYLKQLVDELDLPFMFQVYEAELEVNDDFAQLPDNFVRFQRFGSIFIPGGAVVGEERNYGSFPSTGYSAFPSGPKGGNLNPNDNFYQINGNNIQFLPNSGITKIEIAYLGVKQGEDGAPLIKASYERMIVSYMKWKYAQTFPREFGESLRAEFQTEYRILRRKNKGRENLLTQQDREVCHAIMNRFIL